MDDEYVELLIGAETELKGPRPEAWLDRLDGERDRLDAALDGCLELGDTARALALGGAVWPFWMQRGPVDGEGREHLAALLGAPGAEARTLERAKALHGAGTPAFLRGDEAEARREQKESLSIARQLGDAGCEADALLGLARAALLRGEHGRCST